MNINNKQVTEHGCEANKNGHSHFHTNFKSGMNSRWWRCLSFLVLSRTLKNSLLAKIVSK